MIGIIGGSGLAKLVGLQRVRREIVRTPWGQPSSALSFGELRGAPVVFMVVYSVIFAATALFLLLAAVKWFRELAGWPRHPGAEKG